MDTNEKQQLSSNMHINTFTDGMNSDTAYDQLPASLYLFAKNIRITNNTIVGTQADSNSSENLITALEDGIVIIPTDDSDILPEEYSILACDGVGNISALIIKLPDCTWKIYKIVFDGLTYTSTLMFTSSETTDKDKFSIVINKEFSTEEDKVTTEHIKLYIADGKHLIMTINLGFDKSYYLNLTEHELISNHIFPTEQILLYKQIQGRLKTSQIQYTYRYYKKYGINSRLAPVSNKILIISSYRNKINGNEYDTETDVGFQLKINNLYGDLFDHVQVYRLDYYTKNDPPEIKLISDVLLDSDDIIVTDDGYIYLYTLSYDEFMSLDTTSIIPQVLEKNQGYLFAANIKDDTVLQLDYDAKAYRFNADGITTLYDDESYDHETAGKFWSGSYALLKNSDWKANGDCVFSEYANVNNSGEDEFPFQGDGITVGGEGKNISWEFIVTQVELDGNGKSTIRPNYEGRYGHMYVLKYDKEADKYEIVDGPYYPRTNYYYQRNLLSSGSHEIAGAFRNNYDDIYTSSLCRSLRRGETYRYGIVFYDKFGRRTEVKWIADIKVPTLKQLPITTVNDKLLNAISIGLMFNVTIPDDDKIVGYEIVRCPKTFDYTKAILLCAMSRPILQGKYGKEDDQGVDPNESYKTPYYPSLFLSTLFVIYTLQYYYDDFDFWSTGEVFYNYTLSYFDRAAQNLENNTLFQLFSPLFDYTKELSQNYNNSTLKVHSYYKPSNGNEVDLIGGLNFTDIQWKEEENLPGDRYSPYIPVYTHTQIWEGHELENTIPENKYGFKYNIDDGFISIDRAGLFVEKETSKGSKRNMHYLAKMYDITSYAIARTICDKTKELGFWYDYDVNFDAVYIKNIELAKNINWNEGLTDHKLNADTLLSVTRNYINYKLTCGSEEYVNWGACGVYNVAPTHYQADTQDGNYQYGKWGTGHWTAYLYHDADINGRDILDKLKVRARSWMGPGPRCALVELDSKGLDKKHVLNNNIYAPSSLPLLNNSFRLGTLVANIEHTASNYAGVSIERLQQDVYIPQGFYFTKDITNYAYVFDGDTYITNAEFVNQYKTYDFNDLAFSLQSGLTLYYIPLESDINTCFDYGCTHMNTESKNILAEPGSIEGITTQDRPNHLYNEIYSDNNRSYTEYTSEKIDNYIEKYNNRVYYSVRKLNGESIDNWTIFKPVDYIDVDTKYGDITQLMSGGIVLYYWLDTAFGKFSINERSLTTDDNGNSVQLGMGGVLNRYDYISTNYGMRPQDYSSIYANNTMFWIDMYDNAILACDLNTVINYGERLNTLNYINANINKALTDRPTIAYDVLNQELSCELFDDGSDIVYNLKLNKATSIYTRNRTNMLYANNTMYTIDNDSTIKLVNYLTKEHEYTLLPTAISFVVNPSASVTKVFDNQEICIMYHDYSKETDAHDLMMYKTFAFETNMTKDRIYSQKFEDIATNREGNIRFAIPREGDVDYGNRMRGKWMKETIEDTHPSTEFTISNIITRFRRSNI